ncbi:CDP-diacylglycerol--inositol 3-phosphatidyltransferase, partial [Enteropsectra breve]
YYPNLVDYLRLGLLFASIFLENVAFVGAYIASVSLDYFDGMLARTYDQASRLGQCLDMITDRISTTIISIKLMAKKPWMSSYCLIYIFFDILGHLFYFIAQFERNAKHKEDFIMRALKIYYHATVLKIMCIGSELYFIAAYHFKKSNFLTKVLAPVPVIKTFFHIMHLYEGLCMLSLLR